MYHLFQAPRPAEPGARGTQEIHGLPAGRPYPQSHGRELDAGASRRVWGMSRMAIRKIARMGHPVLKEISSPIEDPAAPGIASRVQDFIDTCEDVGGNGIAAPQIYEHDRRRSSPPLPLSHTRHRPASR